MTFVGRRRSFIGTVLAASAALAFVSCASSDAPTDESDDAAAQEAPAVQPIDIPEDTAAGQESTRILEILNAEQDTTAEDWEEHLHPSFTAEVSVEELVDLFNQNLRPAQPFTATDYDGGEGQAVTTLNSPVSDPIDMTVALDADGLITGLFFGESGAAD